MIGRRHVHLLALLLLGGLVASCFDSAGTTDAAVGQDVVAINDLAADAADAGLDARTDDRFDAGMETAVDGGRDAAVDRPDVPNPWGDALQVDVDGIPVLLDPHAMPAPGSECTSDASVRPGDPTIAPPRPIRPLSVSRVTSQRPTFQWVLPEGTTGARIEVCADRCCTRVIQTVDAEGTTTRPMTALPPGVVFWRMFGRRAGVVGSRASYTWEFEVRRRDAPNDTTWGTIRDFNGDGFDDLMVFRPASSEVSARRLLFVAGSTEGLRDPVVTGIIPTTRGSASVGDLNGDGIADLAWNDRAETRPFQSWISIMHGAMGRPLSARRLDVEVFGKCSRTWSASIVDWNGDGYSDLLLAVAFRCDLTYPPASSLLLGYSGSSAGIADVPQWAIRLDGRFFYPQVDIDDGTDSVDIDRDGYGDVFVRSYFSGSGPSTGPAEHAVIHGRSGGEARVEPVVAPFQDGRSDGFPCSVGDVDGDGFVDVGIRAIHSGAVPVVAPSRGWESPGVSLTDPVMGSNFGTYISSGDINGDGLSDVIVSSENAAVRDRNLQVINVGRVYVFPGPVGPGREPIWIERVLTSPVTSSTPHFGAGSMSPGDINGDGIDDVVMMNEEEFGLCTRYGRTDLSSGAPDSCLNGILPIGFQFY